VIYRDKVLNTGRQIGRHWMKNIHVIAYLNDMKLLKETLRS